MSHIQQDPMLEQNVSSKQYYKMLKYMYLMYPLTTKIITVRNTPIASCSCRFWWFLFSRAIIHRKYLLLVPCSLKKLLVLHIWTIMFMSEYPQSFFLNQIFYSMQTRIYYLLIGMMKCKLINICFIWLFFSFNWQFMRVEYPCKNISIFFLFLKWCAVFTPCSFTVIFLWLAKKFCGMKFHINMVNNNHSKFGNPWIRVNTKLSLIFFGGVGRGGGSPEF